MEQIPTEVMELIKQNYAHLSQESQEAFNKGYQLAHSQRWGLLENVREDRNRYREAFESQIVEIAQQDSDIAALTEKCEGKEKEIAELKRLLRQQYFLASGVPMKETEIGWDKFKTANNL